LTIALMRISSHLIFSSFSLPPGNLPIPPIHFYRCPFAQSATPQPSSPVFNQKALIDLELSSVVLAGEASLSPAYSPFRLVFLFREPFPPLRGEPSNGRSLFSCRFRRLRLRSLFFLFPPICRFPLFLLTLTASYVKALGLHLVQLSGTFTRSFNHPS